MIPRRRQSLSMRTRTRSFWTDERYDRRIVMYSSMGVLGRFGTAVRATRCGEDNGSIRNRPALGNSATEHIAIPMAKLRFIHRCFDAKTHAPSQKRAEQSGRERALFRPAKNQRRKNAQRREHRRAWRIFRFVPRALHTAGDIPGRFVETVGRLAMGVHWVRLHPGVGHTLSQQKPAFRHKNGTRK